MFHFNIRMTYTAGIGQYLQFAFSHKIAMHEIMNIGMIRYRPDSAEDHLRRYSFFDKKIKVI
jgi:hypothetical protein